MEACIIFWGEFHAHLTLLPCRTSLNPFVYGNWLWTCQWHGTIVTMLVHDNCHLPQTPSSHPFHDCFPTSQVSGHDGTANQSPRLPCCQWRIHQDISKAGLASEWRNSVAGMCLFVKQKSEAVWGPPPFEDSGYPPLDAEYTAPCLCDWRGKDHGMDSASVGKTCVLVSVLKFPPSACFRLWRRWECKESELL